MSPATSSPLVRREERMSTSQRVSLHPALERVFGQHLDDSAAIVSGLGIPLEVSVRDFKSRVQLVRGDLVRREDSERVRVELNDLGHVLAGADVSMTHEAI